MKKIYTLLAVLMLSGCSSLLQAPSCDFQEKEVAQVKKSELIAVIDFADGSSKISPANNQVLKKVADKALNEDAKIVVYGHASHRTVTKNILQRILVNLKISNERAISVSTELMKDGVPATDIVTLALFDSRPIVAEVDRRAEAINRRAEVYLYWLE